MYWNDMKESSKISSSSSAAAAAAAVVAAAAAAVVASSSSSSSFTMNCMKYIIKRGANNKKQCRITNKQKKKFTE